MSIYALASRDMGLLGRGTTSTTVQHSHHVNSWSDSADEDVMVPWRSMVRQWVLCCPQEMPLSWMPSPPIISANGSVAHYHWLTHCKRADFWHECIDGQKSSPRHLHGAQ